MRHLLLKTGAAAACTLAILAAMGPAQAVSRLSLEEAAPLVVPVVDQEDLAVEEDLRPDEPPEAAGGKKEEVPKGSAAERPTEEGSGNVENQELWRDLETGETPPPGD